jgi:hypothetical protein
MPDDGPFGTEDEARMTPAVRAIYDAMRSSGLTDADIAATDAMCTDLIVSACDAAGVELGAYDERIAAWMGNWEPQVCQVIAGWVARAHEAGRAGHGPLPSAAAIRTWLVEHDWKVIGTGPGGSLHRSPSGVEVGVPHGDGYPRGIAFAVERIAEAEGRDVTELTRELRNLFKRGDDA